MSKNDKITLIKEIIEEAGIKDEFFTPDQIYEVMKDKLLYEIAQEISDMICAINRIRDVVEED